MFGAKGERKVTCKGGTDDGIAFEFDCVIFNDRRSSNADRDNTSKGKMTEIILLFCLRGSLSAKKILRVREILD